MATGRLREGHVGQSPRRAAAAGTPGTPWSLAAPAGAAPHRTERPPRHSRLCTACSDRFSAEQPRRNASPAAQSGRRGTFAADLWQGAGCASLSPAWMACRGRTRYYIRSTAHSLVLGLIVTDEMPACGSTTLPMHLPQTVRSKTRNAHLCQWTLPAVRETLRCLMRCSPGRAGAAALVVLAAAAPA